MWESQRAARGCARAPKDVPSSLDVPRFQVSTLGKSVGPFSDLDSNLDALVHSPHSRHHRPAPHHPFQVQAPSMDPRVYLVMGGFVALVPPPEGWEFRRHVVPLLVEGASPEEVCRDFTIPELRYLLACVGEARARILSLLGVEDRLQVRRW